MQFFLINQMMNRSVRNIEGHVFNAPLILGLQVLWTWKSSMFVWLLHSDSSLRRKIGTWKQQLKANVKTE